MAKRPTPANLKRHVEDLYKKGASVAKKYRELALVNESFVHGNQWDAVVTQRGKQRVRHDEWPDDEGVPRISVNETAPLLMTWSALMTKDRPTVVAEAANDDIENAYRAEIGNVVISFLENELDTANKTHKSVHTAGMHGTGGLKIVFDPKKDKVTWSVLRIFDFVIDPRCRDWRDAEWVIFEDHIGMDEAVGHFEEIRALRKPNEAKYRNHAGDELEGVPTLELWQRPCRDYPKGLYVYLVDGEVVLTEEEYPYTFEDDSGQPQYPLPLVLMRTRDQDSVYGGTNLTDVIPLQRAYNEVVSRIQKLIKSVTRIHLLLPQSMKANYLADETAVFYPDNKADAVKPAGFTSPGEISQRLFEQRDFFAGKMQTVMGLNDVTVGTQEAALSGRAIEDMVQLDEQKNADATKEAQAMVRDGWDLTWRLVGRFYSSPRKAEIANASMDDVLAFDSTDVNGRGVRLEPASQIDKLAPAKRLATAERVKAGIDTPLDMAKARGGPGVAYSRQAAESLIEQVLAGEAVEVSVEDLNLDVVSEAIQKRKARALTKRDMETWSTLEWLRRELAGMAPAAAPAEGADVNPSATAPVA